MAKPTWRQDEEDLAIAEWGRSAVRTHSPVPGRVVVWRCRIDDADDVSAVVRDILDRAAQGERRIITWETPDRSRINRALVEAGCTVHRRKLFVRRELVAGDLPPTIAFDWRTLAEAGEAALRGVLWDASQGDPFEDEDRDPQREWMELVAETGDDLDRHLWRIARWRGETVGVLLPTLWEGKRREGTLSYIGILPAHRGRGLGRALHAAGLRLLAGAGAHRYVGSTDERNRAMARVFARNGCRTESVQLYLDAPGPTGRG